MRNSRKGALLCVPALLGTLAAATGPRVLATFDPPQGDYPRYLPHMPKLAVLPDGRLVSFSIPIDKGAQAVTARYSADGGKVWTEPEILFSLPAGQGTFGYFERLVDRDGEIHLFFLQDAGTGVIIPPPAGTVRPPQRLDIWHVRSYDQRSRWQAPKLIWKGRGGDLRSVIQLRSGRLLLPISYATARSWGKRGEGPDAYLYKGRYSSSAMYSDDRGETWQQSPDELKVPVPDLGTLGAVEPVVFERKDGSVWMLIRTQMGRFYESFSADGARWSEPRPTSIVSSDAPASLARLPDGRIILLWNQSRRFAYAYGGRQVLHGAVSSDEGRTWRGYREVVRDPLRDQPPPPSGDNGVAYPFDTVTRDGKLLFTLYVTTDKPRSVYELDPAWLTETSQSEDFSTGLDNWSAFGTRGVTYNADPADSYLSIRKPEKDWASGAVWNFPDAARGTLRLGLQVTRGFKGGRIGLTDHFSPPFDPEDQFHNLFDFEIPRDLKPDAWHTLSLRWDTGAGVCAVSIDGAPAGTLRQTRRAGGVHYLRLRSTAPETDEAGFAVKDLAMEAAR